MGHRIIYVLILMVAFCTSGKGQTKTDFLGHDSKAENVAVKTSRGPRTITRTIKQDRKGTIWIASWDGVFRYDGKWFTNVTSNVSSARFFSILEDRKGNLWFGSIGSGVYYYDGKSFHNFTVKDGLLNNDVGSIFEDKKGNIWFGVFGGASRYDGKSFQNYIVNEETMTEDETGKSFPDRPPYEVTSIIEDQTGKLWFATTGNTFLYDGKTFTVFKKSDGTPFTNVRSLIEDKKANIWLSGNDGLWRYNGNSFTHFTPHPTGYVYEDQTGNIWTGLENKKTNFGNRSRGSTGPNNWALLRYNEKSLNNENAVPDTIRANERSVFGILEANDGSIWFGTMDGVYRYDGNTISDFMGLETGK